MFGTSPPRISRQKTAARMPDNDPYTASNTPRARSRGGRNTSTGRTRGYRTKKDWQTLDPNANADYHEFDRDEEELNVRQNENVLAGDYVDVWAEAGDYYEPHTPYRGEWMTAIQGRTFGAPSTLPTSTHTTSSSSSTVARSSDPLKDALFLARSTARTHQYDSDNSNAEDDVPDTRRTSASRQPVRETNIEKDVGEEDASQSSTADDSSSYCPSNGDESDSIESQSDTQEMDQHPSPYDMRSRKHANLPDLSLDNTIKSTFPVGNKNARRKRERMNLRLQKTAAHIQQRCDDTEQEILSKASSNGSRLSNATGMDVDEHVTPLSSANQPISAAASTLPNPPSANPPPPPPKSNAPQMKRNFTTNDFFDALESAIQHAQSSGNTIAFNNNTDEQDERSKEINPEVPITPYMKQIVGSIMSEIDTVVAYRMIFTVDYIKHVHQYWQSRMNIPMDKRPRMTLKTAAAFLRNDSLYIDKCRVIDMNNGREDFGSTGDLSYSNPQTSGVKTMVQFNCKFNSLCAEDQEEADRKRKPFRPFNEIELRADVDEYCIFTILWACDPSYNSDACTNAALADNANAYDQAPMGNIIVYWHSCQFGFRANASVQV